MFAAPASLLLLAIYIVPMLVLAGFSVTDYQLGALTTRFVGLGNFVKAFQDPVFLRALTNTAIYAVIVIPFGKWPISFPSPQRSSPWRRCGSSCCTLPSVR